MKSLLVSILIISLSALYTNAQVNTSISQIQGTGNFSSFNNDLVRISSVVVIAVHEDQIFVQSTTSDSDSRSSEGLMVFWNNADEFEINDELDIVGRVREFRSNTILEANSIIRIGRFNSTIVPIELNNSFPGSNLENVHPLESVEGQLVSFSNISVIGPSEGSDLSLIHI